MLKEEKKFNAKAFSPQKNCSKKYKKNIHLISRTFPEFPLYVVAFDSKVFPKKLDKRSFFTCVKLSPNIDPLSRTCINLYYVSPRSAV